MVVCLFSFNYFYHIFPITIYPPYTLFKLSPIPSPYLFICLFYPLPPPGCKLCEGSNFHSFIEYCIPNVTGGSGQSSGPRGETPKAGQEVPKAVGLKSQPARDRFPIPLGKKSSVPTTQQEDEWAEKVAAYVCRGGSLGGRRRDRGVQADQHDRCYLGLAGSLDAKIPMPCMGL